MSKRKHPSPEALEKARSFVSIEGSCIFMNGANGQILISEATLGTVRSLAEVIINALGCALDEFVAQLADEPSFPVGDQEIDWFMEGMKGNDSEPTAV